MGKLKTRKQMYGVWFGMNRRCYNKSRSDYKYYGGRGIGVCQRWRDSFAAFIEDMGYPESRLELDRIDNDLGYSKENCRWATRSQQTRNCRRNRIVSDGNVSAPLASIAELHGIDQSVLRDRISRGWPVDRALSQPVQKSMSNKLTKNDVVEIHRLRRCGEKQKDIAAKFSVTQSAISMVLRGHVHAGVERAMEVSRRGKLSESAVAEIKRRLAGGDSVASIARLFSVNEKTVYNIRNGETWST